VRPRRSTVTLGLMAAGLVLSQAACSPTSKPATAQSPTPSGATSAPANYGEGAKPTPTPTAKPPTGDAVLTGKRQIVIRPVQSTESIVAVDDKGRLNLTDGDTKKGLFVLTPSGDKFLIKTAKAELNGEPSCMGVKNNGTGPLTVVAAACDTSRPGQLFTITTQKPKDKSGHPTYAISNQDAFLQISPQHGLIAEELGDAPLRTTYAFADNGPAALPNLD
jgi:hypothetical protein